MYYNFYCDEVYTHNKIEKYTTTLAFKFIFIRSIMSSVSKTLSAYGHEKIVYTIT